LPLQPHLNPWIRAVFVLVLLEVVLGFNVVIFTACMMGHLSALIERARALVCERAGVDARNHRFWCMLGRCARVPWVSVPTSWILPVYRGVEYFLCCETCNHCDCLSCRIIAISGNRLITMPFVEQTTMNTLLRYCVSVLQRLDTMDNLQSACTCNEAT
jgi:hypothetical protein